MNEQHQTGDDILRDIDAKEVVSNLNSDHEKKGQKYLVPNYIKSRFKATTIKQFNASIFDIERQDFELKRGDMSSRSKGKR